jgi:hypothetical protein
MVNHRGCLYGSWYMCRHISRTMETTHKISLKGYGLLALMEQGVDVENTVSDKDISATYRELLKWGKVSQSGDKYIIASIEDQTAIQRLYPNNRIYSIIDWFYEKEGLYFTSDEQLRRTVESDYNTARQLQHIETDILYKGYEYFRLATPEKINNESRLQGLLVFLQEKNYRFE